MKLLLPLWYHVYGVKKMGYVLDRTTRIDREYVEKLPLAIAIMSEPFSKAVKDGQKIRVTIDYDPADSKVTLNYSHSSDAQD